MAELVLKDGCFKVGSSNTLANLTTTLSPYVRSITVNYAAELLDKTAMGTNSRQRKAGLKDWSITVSLHQDFASSDVDKMFYGLIGTSNCYVGARATSTSPAAANPEYRGWALLEGYTPLNNAVGELATFDVTFQGNGDLARGVTTL